jgi:hypothetical protein
VSRLAALKARREASGVHFLVPYLLLPFLSLIVYESGFRLCAAIFTALALFLFPRVLVPFPRVGYYGVLEDQPPPPTGVCGASVCQGRWGNTVHDNDVDETEDRMKNTIGHISIFHNLYL